MTQLAKCLGSLFVMAAAVLSEGKSIEQNLVHRTLENGLNVILLPRPGATQIGAVVYVDAGSAEEGPGETGLAHLLEHMAFKGTPHIGTRDWKAESALLLQIEEAGTSLTRARQQWPEDKQQVAALSARLRDLQREAARLTIRNEYDRIISRQGGQRVNATTSVDFTNYFMIIPGNKLELWCLMESQRLAFPAWREFYEERDVVAEERRSRTEDTPTGRIYEEFVTAAFRAHPYKNPTIGWMSDINSLTITRTAEFYRRWYVPASMTIVLVGDLEPTGTMAMVEKYFGTMPGAEKPTRAHTLEPPQTGTRRAEVVFDAQPQILLGWKQPALSHPDSPILEVVQALLSTGRLSRLYDRLVTRDGLASEVSAFDAPGEKYPGMLCIYATPRPPHNPEVLEKAILEEVDRLTTEPVTTAELDRVRNQIELQYVARAGNDLGLALEIGRVFLCTGDPLGFVRQNERMKAVTPEDIQRVAKLYLTRQNLTVATLRTGQPNTMMPARPEATAENASTEGLAQ